MTVVGSLVVGDLTAKDAKDAKGELGECATVGE